MKKKHFFLTTKIHYEPKVVSEAIFTTKWGIFQLIKLVLYFSFGHQSAISESEENGIFLLMFIVTIIV